MRNKNRNSIKIKCSISSFLFFISIIGCQVVSGQDIAIIRTQQEAWVNSKPKVPKTDIIIDFSQSTGKFKPVNGVNGGPFDYGNQSISIEGFHTAARFPFTRLHDANWPHPDAVDINTIFPIFSADPDDPKNYIFDKTDDYIASIIKTKSKIIYRLGESIEHKTNYFINPPLDYNKWAKICTNIIRHYNAGWNNGFHYNIRYWEIWNEPEGKAMWSGTQEQYFKLYEIAAKKIKAFDPLLKVGGPASTGARSVIVKPFLQYCKNHSLPLDFFSWHLYSQVPGDYMRNAKIVRALLNKYGYINAESFLDEWHYITSWMRLSPKDSTDTTVEEQFAKTVSSAGAAFSASVLMILQNSPVDEANFYCADYSPWSMFNPYGVPSKTYFVFKAYHQLVNRSYRVLCRKLLKDSSAFASAGLDENGKSAVFMVSNTGSEDKSFNISLQHLPGKGNIHAEIYRVDKTSNLELKKSAELNDSPGMLTLDLPAESVCLVKLRRN